MITWTIKLINYKPSMRGVADGAVDLFWEAAKQTESNSVIYNKTETGVCSVEFNEQDQFVSLTVNEQPNALSFIWNHGVNKPEIENQLTEIVG